MRHTHSFLIKVLLPLLLLTGFALPLLPVRVPWYVFCILLPLGGVVSLMLLGAALLYKEERALKKDRLRQNVLESNERRE